MGYLQRQSVHVDKHLTNIAMDYRPEGMIWDKILPVVSVQKQSDMIKTYNQADLWRVENTVRAPGTEANKVAFQVGSDNYFAKNYALKTDNTLEDRVNADPAFIRDFESGGVMFLQDKLMLDAEKRTADLVNNSSNVSTAYVVGSAWTDATNSRPFDDIETAKDQFRDNIGYRANRIVFSELAWRNFRRNSQVIDKLNPSGNTGGGKSVSKEQAASLLEVDEVMVGGAMRNSADEGQAITLSDIWDDNVFLYYAPARPSIIQPSFGYSFRWVAPGIANFGVERHPYNTSKKTSEIELGYYQAEKVTSTALGVLITAVTSST